jgi:N-acetyl-gamma-glutamyl-phosphate reductase
MAQLFIDGQAGTTGLQITERLAARDDIEMLTLSDTERKDLGHRRRCLAECDIAILCLPDDAAREAVAAAPADTRILDASTAHRVDPQWTYGLPELSPDQRNKISNARLVSNPGCYPQGFILLIRPLIDAGILSAATPLSCHAVSGYSGGGRTMIEAHQHYDAQTADALNTQAYALTLTHKHVPEMHQFSRTAKKPIFAPSVAHFHQGMLVHIPLHRSMLNGERQQVEDCLVERYAKESYINVMARGSEQYNALLDHGFLNPTACNGTNQIDLMILGNEEQLLLSARYDNLGKGAAGAAVQNLNLMLGLDEATGL